MSIYIYNLSRKATRLGRMSWLVHNRLILPAGVLIGVVSGLFSQARRAADDAAYVAKMIAEERAVEKKPLMV